MKKQEENPGKKAYKIEKQVLELSVTEFEELHEALQKEEVAAALLLNYIWKTREGQAFKKETAYVQVFADENYNDLKIRKLMFKLGQHIDHFFIQKELLSDKHLQQFLLARALSKRTSFSLFEEAVKNAKASWHQETKLGLDYYKAMTELNRLFFFHHGSPQNQPGDESFRSMIENFEVYFSLATLEYGAEAQLRQRIIQENVHLRYLDTVKENSDLFAPPDQQIIVFFAQLLAQLQAEKTEVAVLKQLVEQYHQLAGRLADDDSGLALKWLLNLVLVHTNNGVQELYTTEFELYKLGLHNKLLLENGFLTGTRFTNIVVSAVLANQLDWAQEFIAAYENKVDKSERLYAVLHGKAYWQYFKGLDALKKQLPKAEVNACFEQCRLSLARLINSRNENYSIRARGLQARLHYEWFEQDGTYQTILEDGLAAFEQFLRRRKDLAERRVQSYLSFVSLLRKLVLWEIESDMTQEKLEQLRRQVQEKNPMILRSWLLEKIDALLAAPKKRRHRR